MCSGKSGEEETARQSDERLSKYFVPGACWLRSTYCAAAIARIRDAIASDHPGGPRAARIRLQTTHILKGDLDAHWYAQLRVGVSCNPRLLCMLTIVRGMLSTSIKGTSGFIIMLLLRSCVAL